VSYYLNSIKYSGDEQAFKWQKQDFKEGKSCASCGRMDKPEKMTVDHIKNVADHHIDPFDTDNWQVLCQDCHKRKTFVENVSAAGTDLKARNIKKLRAARFI
jgi:5-methylcytosine-specific restriction endonuclease McrA